MPSTLANRLKVWSGLRKPASKDRNWYACLSPAKAVLCRRQQASRQRRAEFSRQPLGQVFLHREIDDVFRLDHLAGHVVDAAECVGETEIDAARAVPHQPGEEFGRLFEARAAPCLHRGDELLVDLAD